MRLRDFANQLAFAESKHTHEALLPFARQVQDSAPGNEITLINQEKRMLNELRTQRIALSIEVDRARGWRSSAALDQIKKGLEARLTALDKAIKAEIEKQA